MPSLFVGLGLALATISAGCGGGSKYLEDEDWSREQPADAGALREAESLFGAPPSPYQPATVGNRELNGVRLDLSMSPKAQPTARCTCLDVVVGQPGDPELEWGGEKPTLGSEQLIIALRTEGATCPAGTPEPPTRRPSIRAVDRVGSDIIVVVEDAPAGRPIALGAVTSMPDPGGSVYLRPADKHLPYGVPAGSRELCKVFTRGPSAVTPSAR
jgi:hypothetical protein